MKKKIALIITIAVCIVSVSANVYQYRVIRNKDAQIVWNQTTEDQMFQGILGHIQEEILYLQTCEPDEKDFSLFRIVCFLTQQYKYTFHKLHMHYKN